MPKEIELFEKIITRARKTASGSSHNEDVVYALCCKAWVWKQKYRSADSQYKVSKKAYNILLDELSTFEGRISTGNYEKEAREAIKEVREWLQLAIGYRVPAPSNGKCRVF